VTNQLVHVCAQNTAVKQGKVTLLSRVNICIHFVFRHISEWCESIY